MEMTPSVIVTTYNKPKELNLVLHGLNQQKIASLEVIIADDGSTQETNDLIQKWQQKFNFPLIHTWHEDTGNRKAQICDKAVSKAQGNYLLFLDGDSIPDPLWAKDHMRCAQPNTILCGRRVRLGPEISNHINVDFIKSGKLNPFSREMISSSLSNDTKRASLGIRLPLTLSRLLHQKERRLMGVNFSLSKELFVQVGGYRKTASKHLPSKERRREDAQLEILLLSAGAKRYPLLNRAIVYHIYHPERPPNFEIDQQIQARYEAALNQRKQLLKK